MDGDSIAGEDDLLLDRARLGLKGPGNLPSIGDGGLELTPLESLSAPDDLLRDAADVFENVVLT